MNWSEWLLWGFVATVVQTTFSALVQGLGLTRMNIPYILGTMLTADRDRAKLYGFVSHMIAGWIFSFIYVLIFESLHAVSWWRGVIIGIIHAFVMLTIVAMLLPGIHPRMASEQQGPEAQNMLEPPGFLALNYGMRTPLAVVLSHTIFGAILGLFYQVK
jgi:uncharacterized membrane protein YagU involved in acid resistance